MPKLKKTQLMTTVKYLILIPIQHTVHTVLDNLKIYFFDVI